MIEYLLYACCQKRACPCHHHRRHPFWTSWRNAVSFTKSQNQKIIYYAMVQLMHLRSLPNRCAKHDNTSQSITTRKLNYLERSEFSRAFAGTEQHTLLALDHLLLVDQGLVSQFLGSHVNLVQPLNCTQRILYFNPQLKRPLR